MIGCCDEQKNLKRPDRRVSRTRQALRNALMELIVEKGYDAVTVEEITARANLGRTTFYLHYEDKEDLLIDRFRELIDGLFQQLSPIPFSHWLNKPGANAMTDFPARPILIIFQHFTENARLYRVIHESITTRLVFLLQQIISDALLKMLTEKIEKENLILDPMVPLGMFTHYYSGALLGVINWWMLNDYPYPPEEMRQMFQNMSFTPPGRILGV